MVTAMSEENEARLYGRAFLYEMVHTVFGGEPNEALFEALCSPACIGTLQDMRCEGAALARLAGFCECIEADPEARAAELERSVSDFNRVIAGLGANRESFPWESAYTSSKRLLFQVETLEVRNAYRAFGYQPELYPRVADDHLALECAFMAALAKATLEAEDEVERERLLAGQEDFLANHVLKWIEDYARDLHEDAPGGLYDLTAAALVEYAATDREFLGTLRHT